jgi:cellulose synthase (UDP-forming)
VLSTVAGRPQRFRVTPKAITAGARPGPEQRLLLPLLGLLGLQLINLTLLIVGPGTAGPIGAAASSLAPANQALGLTWSLLGGTSLLLALRTCWDRPQDSPVPWLRIDGLTLPLRTPGGEGPASILAISEQGVELVLPQADRAGDLPGDELPADAGHWSLALPGRPGDALPLWPEQRRNEQGLLRIGCRWGPLSDSQTDALQAMLYRGPGEWPSRQAPFEPQALLAVMALLLQPVPPQGWFRRSLLSAAGPLAGQQSRDALAQLADSR